MRVLGKRGLREINVKSVRIDRNEDMGRKKFVWTRQKMRVANTPSKVASPTSLLAMPYP